MPNNEVARRPVGQPAPRQAPAPGSRHEQILFARELAQAGNLPRMYQGNPGAILVIQEYAATLGIPFLTAVVQVNIIEGKPSSSAILIKSLVRKAGHKIRSGHSEDGMTAWCSIWTKQDPEFEYRAQWTLADAERAGLLRVVNGNIVAKGKSGAPTNWEKNPRVMLGWRALTECAREACPEDLLGLYTPDELGYEVTDDGRAVAYDPEHTIEESSAVTAPAGPPRDLDGEANAVNEAVAEDDAEWDELISAYEEELHAEGLRELWNNVAGEPDVKLLRAKINAAGSRVKARLEAGEVPPQPVAEAVDAELVEETPAEPAAEGQ